MATFTLREAIARINKLGDRVAAEAEAYMKTEIAQTTHGTGALAASVNTIKRSDSEWSVGTDLPYAKYVKNGRGVVRPVRAKALHWVDNGQDVFAMRASATKPNDFIKRTKEYLENYYIGL